MTVKKYKLLKLPLEYQDFTSKESVRRLNQELKSIFIAINEGITVPELPLPEDLAADVTRAGMVVLTWDDLLDSYREYLDGARIWRALASLDGSTAFGINSARDILVSCMRTNRYVDHEVDTGVSYIYWVQWIDREGTPSGVAGGVLVTVT